MKYLFLLISFLTFTLVSYLGCEYLIYFSHKHSILDEKTQRSSHSQPTPRIGGISFSLLILLVLSLFFLFDGSAISKNHFLALLLATSIVALVSIVDDVRKGISRVVRLCAHLLAGALALLLAGLIPSNIYLLLMFAISLFAIAWFINLFNFMDGIDGIAASEAIFIICCCAGFSFFSDKTHWALLQLMTLAPILGFMVINWQPAKIFMGDIGSTFLGTLIAISLLINIQLGVLNLWSAIILTSTFLTDASWTLLVRLISGQQWHKPHRSHLYQILSRKWSSHSRVCIWNLIVNVLWVLPMSIAASLFPGYGQVFTIFALLPIPILCIMHRSGQTTSN